MAGKSTPGRPPAVPNYPPRVHLTVEPGRSNGRASVSVVAREEEGGRSLGYAHAVRRPGGWSLEVILDSRADHGHGHDHDGHVHDSARADLIQAAVKAAEEVGAPSVTLWEPHPTPAHDEAAEAAGLKRGRDLFQMRRPLPVGLPFDLEVRQFVVGQDEDPWLEVNNRAFAEHPEQGHWDRSALDETISEPWFDPAGFLLHEREGRLAGFCWTKVHAEERPPMGEIFVIAVDPDFGGQGLGRDLTLAGLDHLCSRGLSVGMLYVDATNHAALRMYEKLGFVVDHIHRGYTSA
jgi:mycothiol synthase